MKNRTLGKTGLSVSEIGLGTWQLGPDWGGVEDGLSQEILRTAVDGNVTFFDTADVYGAGQSEERIGRFIKNHKGRLVIATKLGRFQQPGWPRNYTLACFRQHTEASLKRLGVEAIDLTQVHCIPTEQLEAGEWVEWLEILKKEGKIRHFGASVESVAEAKYCLEKFSTIASLQIIFNIFRQAPADHVFALAKSKKVGLIVRLPLASGLLSGKIDFDRQFSREDHRNYNRDGQFFNIGETFAGVPFAMGVTVAKEIQKQVPPGMTMAQMALRWILDFDAVSVVIPGATRPEQVKENIRAGDFPRLSPALHQNLKDIYKARIERTVRGKY